MIRFLIVNSDYPGFLDLLYSAHPGLEQESYARQLAVRNASRFGVSDYYPRNLADLGHAAGEFHFNNRPLQEAWGREHGIDIPAEGGRRVVFRRGVVPWITRDKTARMCGVLGAQIEEFRPDVILTHAISDLPAKFWKAMRTHYRLLVGQVASPLASDVDLSPFDLMVSSLPNFVERFRAAGLRAELFRLAFDPIVLTELGARGPEIDVSFIGSLTAHHPGRVQWLEQLSREVPIQAWGQGIDQLPRDSTIRGTWHGPLWGIEMFRILSRSRISLNYHIELSGPFANNMRLYETTGVGTLLLTDGKQNLAEMFEPEREAAVFHSAKECAERIRYYLEHDAERARIARAGQERTLRDHTYRQRMAQLVALVQNLL